jgi:cytochrome b subunit of formate dehydrogenase
MPDLEQRQISDAAKGARRRKILRALHARAALHARGAVHHVSGLAATGLPMRFSESFWARRFASGVGGFGAILFLHKFCAVVLTIAFLIHLKDIFQRGIINREKGIFWGRPRWSPTGKT